MLSNMLAALYEPGLMPTINATGIYCYSAVDTSAARTIYAEHIQILSIKLAVILKRQQEQLGLR